MFNGSYNSLKLLTYLILGVFSFSMFSVILSTATAFPAHTPVAEDIHTSDTEIVDDSDVEDDTVAKKHKHKKKKKQKKKTEEKKKCIPWDKIVKVGWKIVWDIICEGCNMNFGTETTYECSGCCSTTEVHLHCSSGCCCTVHGSASHTPDQAEPSIDFYSSGGASYSYY